MGRGGHATYNAGAGGTAVNGGSGANRLNQSFNQTIEQHSSLLNATVNLADKINKNKFLTNSDQKKLKLESLNRE